MLTKPTWPSVGGDSGVWAQKLNDSLGALTAQLSNLDNTSDAAKPLSVAAGAALATKAPIASPSFTGIPTVPTAPLGTSSSQVASTAFVASAVGGGTVIPAPSGAPAVGQVAAVSSVSPLQTIWTTPSAGGVGTTTSGYGVNVLNQAVKNDGIILNDLVVNSGSTTITSASAPFTSTAVDAGKLVYWRTSAGVAYGNIASVQSATSATLTANASASVVTDGGPNTNSVFGTDNTAALNAVFTAAQATQAARGTNRMEQTPTAHVHFPTGVYVTKALTVMQWQGVVVSGDGMRNTFIASGDDAAWFQLGTFNSGYAYGGQATYWQFQDLQFINPCHRNGSSVGNRKGVAIQDNGSGNTMILRCKFVGLRYGFAGSNGTDFTKFQNCYFYLCDVGSYVGPGSQQVDFSQCDWALCREGAVFEGCPHWHIGGGSSWEDNSVSGVTIEAQSSGSTRFGCPATIGGAYYSGSFVIDNDPWFETNSGNNGVLTPRQIWVKGDGPFGVPFQGLVIRDATFVAGGTQQAGGTATFVEMNTNRNDSLQCCVIECLSISNPSFVNSVFRNSGSASTLRPTLMWVTKIDAVAEVQGACTPMIMRRNGQMLGFTTVTS